MSTTNLLASYTHLPVWPVPYDSAATIVTGADQGPSEPP